MALQRQRTLRRAVVSMFHCVRRALRREPAPRAPPAVVDEGRGPKALRDDLTACRLTDRSASADGGMYIRRLVDLNICHQSTQEGYKRQCPHSEHLQRIRKLPSHASVRRARLPHAKRCPPAFSTACTQQPVRHGISYQSVPKRCYLRACKPVCNPMPRREEWS